MTGETTMATELKKSTIRNTTLMCLLGDAGLIKYEDHLDGIIETTNMAMMNALEEMNDEYLHLITFDGNTLTIYDSSALNNS